MMPIQVEEMGATWNARPIEVIFRVSGPWDVIVHLQEECYEGEKYFRQHESDIDIWMDNVIKWTVDTELRRNI